MTEAWVPTDFEMDYLREVGELEDATGRLIEVCDQVKMTPRAKARVVGLREWIEKVTEELRRDAC